MNLSENLLKQANNYLENTLYKTEKSAFELELAQNKELQNYVSITKEMDKQYSDTDWQFIEDYNSKEVDELEAHFKSDEVNALKSAINTASLNYNKKSSTSNSKKIKKYSFLAIAASVVLFFGLYFSNRNENLYNNYNSWGELPSLIERGEVENNLLQDAETAFVSQKYSESNVLYNRYLKQFKTTNSTVYLYLGITELELNQKEKALSAFDKVIENNGIDYSKGFWYKALTYLKYEKKKKAIEQLEFLIQNKNNYKFKEAKKILEKLKDE